MSTTNPLDMQGLPQDHSDVDVDREIDGLLRHRYDQDYESWLLCLDDLIPGRITAPLLAALFLPHLHTAVVACKLRNFTWALSIAGDFEDERSFRENLQVRLKHGDYATDEFLRHLSATIGASRQGERRRWKDFLTHANFHSYTGWDDSAGHADSLPVDDIVASQVSTEDTDLYERLAEEKERDLFEGLAEEKERDLFEGLSEDRARARRSQMPGAFAHADHYSWITDARSKLYGLHD